ncbi:CLUMA_CG020909, isoform A [Clunio marinus]|uniref:Clathrin light chain n=1 Tax=Clunio marinus TaxID=568069 RepID=A0A1J1J757_9DIPT|nr:CLUMA_CG020909, isoform A [Clunio marinus]
MSELVEDFLAREKDGLSGLEKEIPSAFQENGDISANNYCEDDQDESYVKPQSADVPEKIRKWREEQQTRLHDKDIAEEKAKNILRKQAEKELEDWYKRHEETITKTKTLNRNAEKENIAEADEIEPGTEWERIAKLCDFSQSTKGSKSVKDNSRMRSIILQLKQSPMEREKS